MPIAFDDQDLTATRAANERLARLPRLRLHNPLQRMLIRGLSPLAEWSLRGIPGRFGLKAEDRVVNARGRSVRVHILLPPGPLAGAHLHMHGGGWTIGSAQMDDAMNAPLAAEHKVAVVSVEYRMYPSVTIPAMIDDCETAARWLLDSGLAELGAERLTIGGEFAGGHLAAATLVRLRDAGTRFAQMVGAVLTYGCYDLGGTRSRENLGPDTLVLHGPTLGRIVDKATGLEKAARRAPALSPLHADLHGMPPALFIVGTRDPLQEDSELMYERWLREGGIAELDIVPEAAHGFNKLKNSTAEKTNAYVRHWIGTRLVAAGAG